MVKYYFMLIYTLTITHLGILPWTFGCQEDKFIFSSIHVTN